MIGSDAGSDGEPIPWSVQLMQTKQRYTRVLKSSLQENSAGRTRLAKNMNSCRPETTVRRVRTNTEATLTRYQPGLQGRTEDPFAGRFRSRISNIRRYLRQTGQHRAHNCRRVFVMGTFRLEPATASRLLTRDAAAAAVPIPPATPPHPFVSSGTGRTGGGWVRKQTPRESRSRVDRRVSSGS